MAQVYAAATDFTWKAFPASLCISLVLFFLLQSDLPVSHLKSIEGKTIEIKTLNSVQGAAFERCRNLSLCTGNP